MLAAGRALLPWLLGVAVLAHAPDAHADEATAAARVVDGEARARNGDYLGAVGAFKAAEALAPQPAHACLIGLAYVRAARWTQAGIGLARCRAHARAGATVPTWLDQLEGELAAHAAAAGFTEVHVAIAPAVVGARVHVGSVPADELAPPGLLYLAPGRQALTIVAAGVAVVAQAVDVPAGPPVSVTLALPVPAAPAAGPTPGAAAPPPRFVPPEWRVGAPTAAAAGSPSAPSAEVTLGFGPHLGEHEGTGSGGGLTLAYLRGAWRFAVGIWLAGSASTQDLSAERATYDVAVSTSHLVVEACRQVGLLEGCAGAGLGRKGIFVEQATYDGFGFQYDVQRDDTSAYALLSARLGVVLPLGRRLRVRPSLRALLPLPGVDVTAAGRTYAEASPVALVGEVALGLAW